MTMKFSAKWMPAPYEAWGVFVWDEETKQGFCPTYYCNTSNAKKLAIDHAERLESEYQPALPGLESFANKLRAFPK
jgi:hypothetical protein